MFITKTLLEKAIQAIPQFNTSIFFNYCHLFPCITFIQSLNDDKCHKAKNSNRNWLGLLAHWQGYNYVLMAGIGAWIVPLSPHPIWNYNYNCQINWNSFRRTIFLRRIPHEWNHFPRSNGYQETLLYVNLDHDAALLTSVSVAFKTILWFFI